MRGDGCKFSHSPVMALVLDSRGGNNSVHGTSFYIWECLDSRRHRVLCCDHVGEKHHPQVD